MSTLAIRREKEYWNIKCGMMSKGNLLEIYTTGFVLTCRFRICTQNGGDEWIASAKEEIPFDFSVIL